MLYLPGIGPTPGWIFERSPHDPGIDVAVVDVFAAMQLVRHPDTKPDALVSIWDRGTEAVAQYGWPSSVPGLVLEFDDVLVDKPLHGYVAPTRADVEPLVALAPTLQGRVLVHCAAGISRSSAATLILFATRFGPGRELDAVRALLGSRERTERRGWRTGGVSPNRTMIVLADEILGRHGSLVETVDQALDNDDGSI